MKKLEDLKNTDDKPGGRKSELYVYVYNMTEDEWSFIEAVTMRPKQNHFIADCENAADAYYLSTATESDSVYISPKPISQEFQNYAKKLFHFKTLKVITPKNITHLVCDDLLRDSKAFGEFVSTCLEYEKVTVVSYATTPQFYSLLDALKREGVSYSAPETPEINASWTVNFFGSKSGIRQLAQRSLIAEPDFVMPNGLICVGRYDAARIAADKYIKEKGVVLKTNKGSGGNGVLIFRENDLPFDFEACEKKILSHMNSDRYWDFFPIIIESLISINNDQNLSPNVEFKIHKNGRIEFLYICSCKVTSSGIFYGIDISDDIMPDRLSAQVIDMGYYIAEQYAAAGYRGHFDVDMMMAKNGEVFVCESNCRNTGGTDTYRIAKKLIGKDFMDDAYVLSRSRYELGNHVNWSLDLVLDKIDPIIYQSRKKEGVIINSENSLFDGSLIYTIIGKSKKSAYNLERRMKDLLTQED